MALPPSTFRPESVGEAREVPPGFEPIHSTKTAVLTPSQAADHTHIAASSKDSFLFDASFFEQRYGYLLGMPSESRREELLRLKREVKDSRDDRAKAAFQEQLSAGNFEAFCYEYDESGKLKSQYETESVPLELRVPQEDPTKDSYLLRQWFFGDGVYRVVTLNPSQYPEIYNSHSELMWLMRPKTLLGIR